ncbi:M20 metallopeptidase family protein [Paenibacillus methanolicus]|uniref:Amidohydrolase n=1 Tax=Paenibacillus methanolicus TaxID=582686 RepID=A0A5S5C0C2_9BACL|nr:M20 family metallopeptidase [Paenibacillus methanolicus]TYP72058.1 amidohydrolase [Paenibacillus methanolicus]
MKLLERAHELAPEWIAFRRELHRYPELSFAESETAERVARELARLGISYRKGIGGHGIVAEIVGERPGPLIALRADMDALPIAEEAELPFASEKPGVMHACGHDAHTAMLLGAAELLAETRASFAGRVRLLFQPAEEMNAGAKAMVADGALEGVSAIYGLHNLPTLAAGCAAVAAGPMMGSVDRIEIAIEGKGAHGAIPDQGIDPIVCAAALVQSLQTIVSREVSPFANVVVTIGSIRGGEANNVIPKTCMLTGTVRAFDADVQRRLPAIVERIVAGIAASYRCAARLDYIPQVPVLVNEAQSAELVQGVIDETIGAGRRAPLRPTLAGEDFSLYLGEVPGCFFWLGSGPLQDAELAYGLHHPKFTLNEDCIPVGMALLAGIALRGLQRHREPSAERDSGAASGYGNEEAP